METSRNQYANGAVDISRSQLMKLETELSGPQQL